MSFNHQTFVDDWRDEVIYQIVVDRFSDGDPNNNFNVDLRKEAAYHGGDWQGIIDKLDYLEDLGVTALWISPVVRNVEEDAGFPAIMDTGRRALSTRTFILVISLLCNVW
jgi:pullulanase/glycogen debranching enzyme